MTIRYSYHFIFILILLVPSSSTIAVAVVFSILGTIHTVTIIFPLPRSMKVIMMSTVVITQLS